MCIYSSPRVMRLTLYQVSNWVEKVHRRGMDTISTSDALNSDLHRYSSYGGLRPSF